MTTDVTSNLRCQLCRRRRLPSYGGFCVCGASVWSLDLPPLPEKAPPPRAYPLRCAVCKAKRLESHGGFCVCGATTWERIPYEAPAGIVVESLERRGASLRTSKFDALLSKALNGLLLGSTVLVGGGPGAGKSTLCAELAARMADELDGDAYWLDAEQKKELAESLFARTGVSHERIRFIDRHKIDRDQIEGPRWKAALRAVPEDASVVVVDSLQRWTRNQPEQEALLEAVMAMPLTVLLISHFNKKGQFAGLSGNQHDADATAIVTPNEVLVPKCRWTPTPRITKRPIINADTEALEEEATA